MTDRNLPQIATGLVDGLLAFHASGAVSESLVGGVDRLGKARFRVITIGLLDWLKSQNRLRTKRPLPLGGWGESLEEWLSVDRDAAAVFIIKDRECDLSASLDEAFRNELYARVDAAYQPMLRTYYR